MIILNPAILYALTWSFVLILYSLQLSELLQPLKTGTVLLVVGSSTAFVFGWIFESVFGNWTLATPKLDLRNLTSQLSHVRIRGRLLLAGCIFILILAIEIAYFGGIPILSIIGVGTEMAYTDFGISGLHGFNNSLFYSVCSIWFVKNLLNPSSSGKFWLLLISIIYPLGVMSRQVFISLMLQYALLYIFLRRPSGVQFLKLAILAIVVLLVFGYVGDLRSGRDHIISASSATFEYPDWLPSGFIWFYIYVCTPLNNVNFNIDITPNYLPLETAGSFIPLFAREYFLNSLGASRQWNLYNETFNVNSLLQSLLTDFGIVGSIIFTFFCGLALTRLLRRAKNNTADFFTTIIFLHGIALSFFANLLFHLVFIFQIIIIRLIIKNKNA
jgi:oligosaccharide repeat unit polymerase